MFDERPAFPVASNRPIGMNSRLDMAPTNTRRLTTTAVAPAPRLDRGLVAHTRPFEKTRRLPSESKGIPSSAAWVVPGEEAFMLYRDPPPWDSLAQAKERMCLARDRHREQVKGNRELYHSEVARVDLSGQKAVALKQSLHNLVERRVRMREDFGLSTSPSAPSLRASGNPFKRRASDHHQLISTSLPSRDDLVPISSVPTPVFTQELLNVSAKENKKAQAAAESSRPAKKARRSSLPATSSSGNAKQSQATTSKDKSSSTLDLRNWFVAKR